MLGLQDRRKSKPEIAFGSNSATGILYFSIDPKLRQPNAVTFSRSEGVVKYHSAKIRARF